MPTGVYKRDPDKVWKPKPLAERFWSMVDKSSSNGCWNWTGALQGRGYGIISLKHKNLMAHRVSYEIHNGKINKDNFICHLCDNRKCVNPLHLFQGTAKDNTQDASNKNRLPFGENHHQSKLSEDAVIAIRKLRKNGMSGPKLGKIFGVNHVTIYRICKKIIWRKTL